MTAHRLATCPTCNHSGEFELLGVQKWPPQVAEKLGLPSEIPLWSCPHCLTTISDPDLLPYRGPSTASAGDQDRFLAPTARDVFTSVDKWARA